MASEELAQERNNAVRTLGNLALLRPRLNTSVRDYAWKKKRQVGRGKTGSTASRGAWRRLTNGWYGRRGMRG